MVNEWRENEYRDYRKIPEEAKQYGNVDVMTEWGAIWEEENKVIAFIGPCVIEKWRPSASNFQNEMDFENG